MNRIEQVANGWMLTAENLVLTLDARSGRLSSLKMTSGKGFDWTVHPGDVTVRDDLLRKTFDHHDVKSARVEKKGDILAIEKLFNGAPWRLLETYRLDPAGAIQWEAQVVLDSGEYRSCAVSYRIPWPLPLYPMNFWSAREKMPSAPHRFASIALEYGEITSGIIMPALCSYREAEDVGLLLAMPFDFKTPRFRFVSGYRDPDLQAEFDWMALAPGKPARTSLLMRATGGAWRPALGWLYERFKEYFEPRSKLIHKLWGGHVSGTCNVSLEQAKAMVDLGLAWHEVHCHFPAYGNYHPEGMAEWRSGHAREDTTIISVEMIRKTIRNLHEAGSAALPYIQVTGDGDAELLNPAFKGSRLRDVYGDEITAWPGTYLMNSDPSLPFGKDMTRQIKGMVERYPEMDGVFLDQPCYNFLDTAHDDGITAVNNRPCYLTGFNYFPHLELLSSLLHPKKTIIGNAPFGIAMMKYIDGFMAEGSGWLCDHLQWYGLAKPLFFLMYDSTDRDIELMFQRCLVYAAGYTSYAHAAPSKDLYRRYVPLLERLFRRRWVFDPQPIKFPTGFNGGVYRSPKGNLLTSIVNEEPRLGRRTLADCSILVKTADIDTVTDVTVQKPGGRMAAVPFRKENSGLVFDVPGDTIAAVAELHMKK